MQSVYSSEPRQLVKADTKEIQIKLSTPVIEGGEN